MSAAVPDFMLAGSKPLPLPPDGPANEDVVEGEVIAEAPLLPAPPFVPGVFDDMPAEQYFATEAMSQSGAKKMRQSQLHYIVDRKIRRKPTAAMIVGTAIHAAVLEPDTFDQRVICIDADAPDKPSSRQINAKKPSYETTLAIEWWREFNVRSAGKTVLKSADLDMVRRCRDAVWKHPAARELLPGSIIERSMFWRDGQYGVPCKARWDLFNHNIIGDVKSTEDASPEGFAKSVASYEYHAQGAHYISAAEHLLDASPAGFVFIAVEKEEPFGVGVYLLPSEGVLAGAHLMNIALARYADALANGEFRGYADTIEQLKMPRWSLRFDS